jgi:hypothetical protein
MQQTCITMPLGIVIRKSPGVTRWAKWVWRAVAVLPGASQETWKELRREGDTVEYHAATVDLELHRTETEAYLAGLSTRIPAVYVVMREATDPDTNHEVEVLLATVSPYDAQDYADSGEELIDQVPMPDGLMAWVDAFVREHHQEEVFVKRKRDRKRIDVVDDGVGDARISQLTDVYRAPRRKQGQVH